MKDSIVYLICLVAREGPCWSAKERECIKTGVVVLAVCHSGVTGFGVCESFRFG